MPRVKGGTSSRARHKKVLKMAKGYFGSKHRLFRTAHEQVMHSLKYAYRDRRQTKRNMRKLWIVRINAACRTNDISYSKFINGLSKAGIVVNRKMLSEIAIDNPKSFTELVSLANDALLGKIKIAKKVAVKAVKAPVAKKVAVVAEEVTPVVKKTTVKAVKAPVAKKAAVKKAAVKVAKTPAVKKAVVKK